ncbi:MAG: putative exonuclease of the beta-lactamase fold involved in RNA processing [Parcubacteria group bacterium Gr01-1014_70]|nr:MAG: putative exonuclease of the beta-lactamase fold involved in RNA processing [Parcubacteria group bacterium Gr01-1014_70]
MPKLSFYGGAQEVTGACYLLESEKNRILMDCGLFQCPRFCEKRNIEDFPFDPASIDVLLVSHGHIDHIGRIPKLVRKGFRGHIYSTPPTKAFADVMLRDSLGVLEKEARSGEDTLLYEEKDIDAALALWEGKPYGEEFEVGDLRIVFRNAGHILGSAITVVEHKDGERIAFTGDLGNSPAPLLGPFDNVDGVTHMIIESAYGNRVHEDSTERKQKLERVVENTCVQGGTLMIPAFSLERTQQLLYEFNELAENQRIPRVPIFLDSPLAIKATRIYREFNTYFSAEAQSLIKEGDDLFRFPGLTLTERTEESKSINEVQGPKIIIAGAGMMQGGRILHHAKRYLPNTNSTLLFIGYQAAGSLGRRLIDKASEVQIHGETVPVRAAIKAIGGYSAHADSDGLFNYVAHTADTLQRVFVVQGEPAASLFLVQRIKDNLGIEAVAPRYGESFEFD